MALIASATPPAPMTLPCPSVTVMYTRRFMKRPSLVLLSTLGCFLPYVTASTRPASAPYFTRKLFTVAARAMPSFSLYFSEPIGVGVSFQFHFEGRVLAEQFGHSKQAGITIAQNRRIELEIDFFPIILGGRGLEALAEDQGHSRQANQKHT